MLDRNLEGQKRAGRLEGVGEGDGDGGTVLGQEHEKKYRMLVLLIGDARCHFQLLVGCSKDGSHQQAQDRPPPTPSYWGQ